MKTLITLVSLFYTSILFAQWQPDVRLTNDPAVSQTSFNHGWSIASSGDTVHVLFFDERNGFYTQIYYKRSTDKGITWGSDTRLSTSTIYAERGTIAVNGPVVHAVWQDWRNPSWEIYYKRSTDGGATWGADTRLTNADGNSWTPGVFVNGSVIHVVWVDTRDGQAEAYYKRSSDGGLTWGTDIRLSDLPAESWYPVGAASGSNIHVFWTDTRDGNYEIYYKRSTDGGLSWGTDTRLTNTSSYSQNPTVAANGSLIHLVFYDDRDGNYEIYYKRSTDGGFSWGADTRLTNANGGSFNPSLAISGSYMHLTWEDLRDGNYEIYYKRSTNGGSNWDSDSRLTNAAGDSRYASVAVSGTIVHVAWFDERDGNREIYYKRNPGGGPPPSYLTILSTAPAKNALNVPASSNITIQFNENINVSTLTSNNIRLYGSQSGQHNAAITFNTSNNTATINPNSDFKVGEIIEAIVTQKVKSVTNDSLEKPYCWRFNTDVTLNVTSYLLDTSIAVNSPSGTIVFDCDNDGDLDAASNSHDGASVTIYKNNGSGRFSTFATLTGGGLAYTTYPMSCGDFNSDGNIDLAVPVRFSNIVSIWFGTGTGNFTPIQQVGVNYEPQSVDIADFNGDGYLDIVACCNNNAYFYYDILTNDKTGHFNRTQQVNVSNRPDICTTGDIDGDGDIDILASVAVTSAISCYILFNSGSGVFSVSQIPVTNTSYTPTPGDFDGDGDLDLAVDGSLTSAVNGIKILKNNGTGTFTLGQTFGNQTMMYGQKYVRDINNDGYLDIVAAISGDIEIYTNNGTGNFTLYLTLLNNGWPGYSLGVGDINGNGNMEICTPGYNSTTGYFKVYKAYPLLGIISNEIPVTSFIKQNYPNPFNPITKLEFGIEKPGIVKIIIFDILGREIETIINDKLNPGTYEAEFDGTNYPSGVYFYKLETEYYTDTKKMVLLK